MLRNIGNNDKAQNNSNKKTILLVTDNIQQYQHFSNYNINKYKITFISWKNILGYITNFNSPTTTNKNKHEYLELIILDISVSILKENLTTQIKQIPLDLGPIIEKIKNTFYDIRLFFIISSSRSMPIDTFLSMGYCVKREDIHIQPFSIFDLLDLISITNQKERLERLQLKDHCMIAYSSIDDKIKDAIKFLRIGIKNNEATLILLDNDIDLSVFKSHLALDNIDADSLQNVGLLKIEYSKDWYLSFNQKNNTTGQNKLTIDNESINNKFFNLMDQVTKNEGKKGLRVFGMTYYFFENDLVDEIIDYDCRIPPKYNKPMLSICVYSDKYIKKLSENQIRRLMLTHKKVGFN